MFSRHQRKAQLLFALCDILFTTLSFLLAYHLRRFLPLENVFYLSRLNLTVLLTGSLALWILAGRWVRAYERLVVASRAGLIRDALQQGALATVGLILFEFILHLDLSRFFLLSFAAGSTFLITLFRAVTGGISGMMRHELAPPYHILIVGTGVRARELARILEDSSRYGLLVAGFVAHTEEAAPEVIVLRKEYPVHAFSELATLLRQQVVDEVLFAVDSVHLSRLEDTFLLCDEEGVRTRIAIDFFPHVNSEMYLERLGDAPLLTFSATPHDEVLLLLKRLADVLVAGILLLLSLPFMLMLIVLIRMTSPGPAIFRQVRCGLNGRRFVFYKFRSMVDNAEDLKASVSHLNQKDLAFKIPNDPRLTPIGRYLRKFSIDEWPQLWNVVKGDMSLVGPRPAIPEEVARYQPWQRRRLRMRPGLTCLWALNGRDQLDFETWMKMDMQYIDNWSLALDCKILIQTIPSVLLGKGAH